MNNKVSLLTIAGIAMLSGCVTITDNSKVNLVRTQNLEKELQESLDKLRADKKRLEDEKSQLEADKSQLESDKSQLEGEKNQLETDKNNLQNDKNQLQAENDELKRKNQELLEEKKTMDALKTGDWQLIDGNGVDVEKTGDALGFIYKMGDKKITNGKTSTPEADVKKDITLTDNFEKLFEGLIDNSSGTETLKAAEVDKVISALEKFKEGKKISELSGDEQNIIKKLDGCSAGGDIKYETTFGANEAKKKLYDLVLGYLKTKNLQKIKDVDTTGKTLKYQHKEKNELTQGRELVKLKYSDFGFWKRSFDISNLDESLKKYLENDPAIQEKYSHFAIGAEDKKADFNTTKVEKDLTFTGKTFAHARKGKDVKDLSGDVKLFVKQGEGTGKFDLDFENWYKFSLDKLNLLNFTAEAGSNWQVSGSSTDPNWALNNGNKMVSDTHFKGKFYGEDGKLEEVVGTYKFKVKDNSNEIDINGAFGAKK